jgi:ethanolamine utilization protein EutM
MAKQAVGILETRGLACLVIGVDSMLKAANVELSGPMRQVGSGLCSAVVSGDVAAVKAAIDAGAESASQSRRGGQRPRDRPSRREHRRCASEAPGSGP